MTGATDVSPNDVPRCRERRENDGKKFTPRFGLFQSCSEGVLAGVPLLHRVSHPRVGGDDDKSSRDVATHNQIRPSPPPCPVTPPPAPTLDWLFPAPPPTTPDILRDRDSAENTAHVLDVPHTVHPSHPFAPSRFEKTNPRIPSAPLAALLSSAAS